MEILPQEIIDKNKERFEKFKLIRQKFKELDNQGLRQGQIPLYNTSFGLWGTSNLNDVFELFTKIRLERFNSFADLGAGDGRIVAVAALFTKSIGIEGDKNLIDKGNKALEELGIKAELVCDNYYNYDYSNYNIIFMFPDQKYDETMIKKLKEEFKGYLFVYNDIHKPEDIPRGKTYWIRQMPIVSYHCNVEDKNLEM